MANSHTAARNDYAEHANEWWVIKTSIPTGGYAFGGGLYGNEHFAFGDETEAERYVATVSSGLSAQQRQRASVTYRRATLDELVAGSANEAPDTVEMGAALEACVVG